MKPLTSWKEIGAYLGRSSRTVQRWERLLGLPIRRATSSASGIVWAFPTDIDKWLQERHEFTAASVDPTGSLDCFIETLVTPGDVTQSLSFLAKSLESKSNCVISILLLNRREGSFTPLASPSLPADYQNAFKVFPASAALGSAGPAALLNRIVITENVRSDPRWRRLRPLAGKLRISASVALPIRSPEGNSLGCLSAYYSHSYRPTQTDLRRFEIASELVSWILGRTRPGSIV